MSEEAYKIFIELGIGKTKAEEASKNKKMSENILKISRMTDLNKCTPEVGYLLYLYCSKRPNNFEQDGLIIPGVITKDLKTTKQLEKALEHCTRYTDVTKETLYKICGVGVVVSREQIEEKVRNILSNKSQVNLADLFKDLKLDSSLEWADSRVMKDVLDEEIDRSKIEITKTRKENKAYSSGEANLFHKPGENPQINEEIRKKHLEATKGKVYTRFPPEPNGYLHIGHAKAMNFSFNYAKMYDGYTYLRYDDTNPEAEKEEYFNSISDSVRWLGFTPFKITHASDYFEHLYQCALILINKGLAYVCHLTPDEILETRGGRDKRGKRSNSKYRERSIEESLIEFQKMKDGKYKEGEATLRLKMDMDNGNPLMWDLVAYRISYTPHVRTGKAWCIYPMYDFAHCLCDSVENITHSLCTSEFILAREAYYWICDNVGVYKPVQWEYSRLDITKTILSKRNIAKLVSLGIVSGWDDPRLFTLPGLRRRGVPPEAINEFVQSLGITKNKAVTDVRLFDRFVRKNLQATCVKRMAIFDPVKVIIENWDERLKEDMTENRTALSETVYLEREDLRYFEKDGSVGLLETNMAIELISKGEEVRVRITQNKPGHYVEWIPSWAKQKAEIRMFSSLFTAVNPGAYKDIMECVDKESRRILKGCLIDPRISDIKAGDRYQFVRKGYFTADIESTTENPVFNLTIALAESKKHTDDETEITEN
eukprot:GHVP01036190.1.p1 GENE.GHVP01036190.1~~GHVP01036190.1.p1  ORF type:complete len:712 (-),score=124.73 GHVP01036190.1:884-3019(-)